MDDREAIRKAQSETCKRTFFLLPTLDRYVPSAAWTRPVPASAEWIGIYASYLLLLLYTPRLPAAGVHRFSGQGSLLFSLKRENNTQRAVCPPNGPTILWDFIIAPPFFIFNRFSIFFRQIFRSGLPFFRHFPLPAASAPFFDIKISSLLLTSRRDDVIIFTIK